MRSPAILLLSLLAITAASNAQLVVSGQASASFVKSNNGFSQYSVDGGRPTFLWRWDLFTDAVISDHLTFLTNMRLLQDQVPHIDLFALRYTDIASSGISLQAGQIDIPFGNLGERRFPKQNPFIDLPLMNEHITALCESDYKVWVFFPKFAIEGDGVRILDEGLYDLGVKAYTSVGIVDVAAAVINGMISTTGTYSPQGLNSNGDLGKVVRLAVTPMTGLTIGAAYAYGSFMKDESGDSASAIYRESPDEYPQEIAEADVDFSFGHFSSDAMVAYNIWHYIHGKELRALCYNAEVQYAFTPRLTAAARVGGLQFNTISDMVTSYGFVPRPYTGKWDHDVFRLEGAVGWKFAPELLMKVCYQINRTYDMPNDPVDNVFAVQTVVTF